MTYETSSSQDLSLRGTEEFSRTRDDESADGSGADARPWSETETRLQQVVERANRGPHASQLQALQTPLPARGVTSAADPPVQRAITIQGHPPKHWSLTYLDDVYPRLSDLIAGTGATEAEIIAVLKRYDQENAEFASVDKMLEILQQELIVEGLERQVEGVGGDSEVEMEEDPNQIFGQPVDVEESGDYFQLYRAVEPGELEALREMIQSEGIPLFTFKEGKKGNAEKFFAPNKSYVVESMGKKGKRSSMMEITVDKAALEALIYNDEFTTYQGDAGAFVPNAGLKKGKPHEPPSPITLKRENPKGKKGIRYTSINVGFRRSGDTLPLLAEYIVSIRLIDPEYDPKNPMDTLRKV